MEQEEEEQSQPEIGTAEGRLDERSPWNEDTEQPAPFFAESFPSSTLWSPEQRKRVAAESAEYGPAWNRATARVRRSLKLGANLDQLIRIHDCS